MKTILIVEDDKSIRTNLVKLLTLKGYHVLEADSFACYRKMVSKNVVDLYLLDVYLPDGSGFDICADIRTVSKHQIKTKQGEELSLTATEFRLLENLWKIIH